MINVLTVFNNSQWIHVWLLNLASVITIELLNNQPFIRYNVLLSYLHIWRHFMSAYLFNPTSTLKRFIWKFVKFENTVKVMLINYSLRTFWRYPVCEMASVISKISGTIPAEIYKLNRIRSGPTNSFATLFVVKLPFNHSFVRINPCYPESFSQTYFPKGVCCNPPWIINTEGHITLNLLPVYRFLDVSQREAFSVFDTVSLQRHPNGFLTVSQWEAFWVFDIVSLRVRLLGFLTSFHQMRAFYVFEIFSGGSGIARFNVATPTNATFTCTAYVLPYNLQTKSIYIISRGVQRWTSTDFRLK